MQNPVPSLNERYNLHDRLLISMRGRSNPRLEEIPWDTILELMWRGRTFQEACKAVELVPGSVERHLTHGMICFMVDLGCMYNYRDEVFPVWPYDKELEKS